MPSPPGLKKALNFAKFHARGGRGLQQGHPRIGAPLPGHSPRRARRGGTPGGRHTPAATPGGWLPGHTRAAGGYPRRGGAYPAGYPWGGGYVRGYTGRTGAAATRGGRFPGRRATGRNRAVSAAHGGAFGAWCYRAGYPGRRRTRCAGAATRRGLPGRGYPAAGGAAAQPPVGAATPAATGGAKSMIRGRPVTGIRRTGCWAGYRNRGAAGVYRAAGAEIFCGGGGYRGKTPATALSRAYIEALLQTARRGYFLDKTPEK